MQAIDSAGEFGDPAQRDLLAAVAMFGSRGPITIVAASAGHAHLLDNWLCHMCALRIDRLVIIAMDNDLAARLRGIRFPVVRAGFDGSLTDFWFQRARIWACLVDAGVEFIHSDTDAVWLRDPITPYVASTSDVLFSQGTILPVEAVNTWGFVLCCGFFWVRPTRASSGLFRALVAPAEHSADYDDQVCLNRLLVGANTVWRTEFAETYDLQFNGRLFRCFHEPLIGYCASLGLHLTLLPHHLFPRLHQGASDAMVRHVLRSESAEQRVEQLRQAGCWLLDAHPAGFLLSH